IWQMSDIHFGKLNKTENDPCELAAQLAKLATDFPSMRPDIIIVSGDVTSISAETEFAAFKSLCKDLSLKLWGGCFPERILVVPGNHDVTWLADGHADRMKRFVKMLSKKAVCVTPFGKMEELLGQGKVIVRRFKSNPNKVPPVAVVTFSEHDLEVVLLVSGYFSGMVPENIRTKLGKLSGSSEDIKELVRQDLGDVNREYLLNIARIPERRLGLRIGMTHHNPIQYGTETCVNRFAPQLLETLFKKEVRVLFHGHVHLIEDRGNPHPMATKMSYPIPCPTLCSEAIAGGKGMAIHLIGGADEFQNFSTDAFASILAEARKYHLCLTLSHQYIDQLSLPIRQAVFGNVGTLIAFRIGNTDAEVMEKEFGNTFSASTLADLDRYEAVVKLLDNGTNLEPFRAKMLPPLQNRIGRKDKLVALSRERFATPRAKVDGKLKRWITTATSNY
ncbi:MAG: metallophosphoesterase, partial [Candidatus Paceibacterota bacterium]